MTQTVQTTSQRVDDPGIDRNAPVGLFNRSLDDLQAFFIRHRRAFARAAHRRKAMNAFANQPFCESLRSTQVNASIGVKGREHSRDDALW